jgi:hypothetical protein
MEKPRRIYIEVIALFAIAVVLLILLLARIGILG